MPFMRFLTTLLIIVIFCLALIFMYENKDELARVHFGSWSSDQTPIFFIILGAFLMGVVFTSVIGIIEGMKLRVSTARLKKKIKKLQSELDSLRNMPLTASGDPDTSDIPRDSDEDSAL